jgi:hypothetical protein
LPGDKVWMLDYVNNPNSVACDACGHSSCRCIYVVRQVVIKRPHIEKDCVCRDCYEIKNRTLYSEDLYDTEEAAQKAANKLNKQLG